MGSIFEQLIRTAHGLTSRSGGVLAVLAAFGLGAAPLTSLAAQPGHVEGRILVQPAAGLSDAEFSKILGRQKAGQKRRIGALNVHVVNVPPQAEQAVANALAKNPHIKFAELDSYVSPDLADPNDPKFPSAWHLAKIRATQAWDISMAAGVTVAVLDTGVDANHLDLLSRLVPGRNTASNGSDTSDVHGHGTKVAGVIAAQTNNALGVASIAQGAMIMPIRVTDSSNGYASLSAIAAGLNWAADHGATVANISYLVTDSATVRSAAQYFRSKGGVVVAAAGNYGSDAGYTDNPYVIDVSATTSSDGRPSWSSFGQHVDVSAPGVGIWTTTNGGGYGAPSGTSFSSPTTAAVVALIKATNPSLSPDEVEAVLKNTVNDIGDTGYDPYFGWGRVNAQDAVALASNAVPSDTQPPSVRIDSPAGGASVSGIVSIDATATDNFGVSSVDLLVNNLKVASDNTAPFDFSWDSTGTGNGTASLVARAYDAAGNHANSTIVQVDVNNGSAGGGNGDAPVVNITSPADGVTVSGSVSIGAKATDSDGIYMLTIKVDGKTRCSQGSSVISCGWNTRKASAGAHTITAEATDKTGKASSVSLTVYVATGSDKDDPGKGKGRGKNKG